VADHNIDHFALCLAEEVMRERTGTHVNWYDAWVARREGGPPHPARIAKMLTTLVSMAVGPKATPKPDDQIEAFVAEQPWYHLVRVVPTDPIAFLIPPSLEVTEIGGDGLAIHRMPDDSLQFRLWEVKKHTGTAVSSTVGLAYTQLQANGLKYLAKISAAYQHHRDAELANFVTKIMEMWVDADQHAAAGVWVGLSDASIPKRCFSTFGNRFPDFADPRRMMGGLSSLPDFPAFARRVSEWLWIGL
jgi:hypothetical protein